MKRMEELIHLNKKIHFEGKVDDNISRWEQPHSFSVHLLYTHVQYIPLSPIHCWESMVLDNNKSYFLLLP
jgi:hypothetical protein